MPIYEYDCQKCHERTEVIQGYSDPPLKICPHCGGKLKKAISAPAIQFKGSGWYVTDYGKGGSGPRKKEKESEAGKSEGSSDSSEKTEKKSDAAAGESGGGGESGKTGGEKKPEPSKKKAKKAD